MPDVTLLLAALEDGDEEAADRLLGAVYQELRRLAAAKLARERSDHTLQPTALVHEAWLRLAGSAPSWQNRRHFFAAAAEAMRRILVERARRRSRLRHGGAHRRRDLDGLDLSGPEGVAPEGSLDLVALDEALTKLAAEDGRKAALVELRYFAGLSIPEAADVLEISKATADRWWAYARAFLFHEISKGDPGTGTSSPGSAPPGGG